jgi:hypothetical protein
MTDYAPTAQQQAAINAAVAGESFVVQARAGSGKTATARQIAKALPDAKILYMAFNKSTQVEASNSFPANVIAKTSHSLAWSIGSKYRSRMTRPMGTAQRVPAWKAATQLSVKDVTIGDVELPASQVLRLALAAVARFSRSADTKLTKFHVARQQGLEDSQAELVAAVLPLAERCWEDIKSGHVLTVQGEHYIKIWALSHPKLRYDVIIYDEAQDANGAIAGVVHDQDHAQIIAIGDSAQAINGWNGAIDALAKFEAKFGHSYPLSKSFRFGQAVADAGNNWLRILGVPDETLVEGFEAINSTTGSLDNPDAILCRTNAGCVSAAMSAIKDGKKVAIVGGGDAIKSLAQAAIQLQAGAKTTHPDLIAFKSWEEVQEYAKEDEGADLRPFVKIIDTVGADEVINAMNTLANEKYADVTVSTMHKSKGREWKTVRIYSDCPEPKESADGSKGTVSDAMAMLYYVASTRAQLQLDATALAWVTEYI